MKGSFCESRKNSFINYQKETSCIFMLQLSAKHINIYSCQTSSSLNLSNRTALIHTGLLFHTALAHNLCRKKNHITVTVTSLPTNHIHDSPTKSHPGCLLHLMLSEAQQQKPFWLKTCVAVECRWRCAGHEVSPRSA